MWLDSTFYPDSNDTKIISVGQPEMELQIFEYLILCVFMIVIQIAYGSNFEGL